jgi:hypothetical protein
LGWIFLVELPVLFLLGRPGTGGLVRRWGYVLAPVASQPVRRPPTLLPRYLLGEDRRMLVTNMVQSILLEPRVAAWGLAARARSPGPPEAERHLLRQGPWHIRVASS